MMAPWLTVALLGAVVLVYSFLLPAKEAGKSKGAAFKEIEETIENFATEIEEENRELLNLFADMKSDYARQNESLLRRLEFLEKRSLDLTEELVRRPLPTAETANASPAVGATAAAVEQSAAVDMLPEPEEPQAPEPMTIRHRYAELFELYEQGKSTESIARKLGMNKGEVQLIIQLARQEEAAHAQE